MPPGSCARVRARQPQAPSHAMPVRLPLPLQSGRWRALCLLISLKPRLQSARADAPPCPPRCSKAKA